MSAFRMASALLLCVLLSPPLQAADFSPAGNVANLAPVIPPAIILAPTEIRTDPTLAKGCWARLFPQTDLKGVDDITIAGPIELPSLHTPISVDWRHRTESLLVGPKATLTVYEDEHFKDRAATFKPGTQVLKVRQQLKFTQSINSLKITCSQ